MCYSRKTNFPLPTFFNNVQIELYTAIVYDTFFLTMCKGFEVFYIKDLPRFLPNPVKIRHWFFHLADDGYKMSIAGYNDRT